MSLSFQKKYSYFLLGSPQEFDSMRELYAHYKMFKYKIFKVPNYYGWWIVRRNERTNYCVAFEFRLNKIYPTLYNRLKFRKDESKT